MLDKRRASFRKPRVFPGDEKTQYLIHTQLSRAELNLLRSRISGFNFSTIAQENGCCKSTVSRTFWDIIRKIIKSAELSEKPPNPTERNYAWK